MIRLVLLLTTVAGLAWSGRYFGVEEVGGLKRLLGELNNNFFATCELALFTTPANYDDATKQCSKFSIGVKTKKSNLVTIDSEEKLGHLLFLYDLGVTGGEKPLQIVAEMPLPGRFNATNWIWSGLRKVTNTQVQGKGKREVKNYNPDEWKWLGTGQSPLEYSNWPKKKKSGQPDQSYMKKKKKKNNCRTKGGCYQNQVRVDAQGWWDDGWNYERHIVACDYKGKYILSNQRKTWERALEACQDAGLTLAMVRSKKEVTEMMEAINYFLGPADEAWDTWDADNWVWLGGNDIKKEGVFRWQNKKKVDNWDVPWITKAGKDNAEYIKNADGQHAIAFSRWGEFDDSYHGHKKRQRPFACQCPDS